MKAQSASGYHNVSSTLQLRLISNRVAARLRPDSLRVATTFDHVERLKSTATSDIEQRLLEALRIEARIQHMLLKDAAHGLTPNDNRSAKVFTHGQCYPSVRNIWSMVFALRGRTSTAIGLGELVCEGSLWPADPHLYVTKGETHLHHVALIDFADQCCAVDLTSAQIQNYTGTELLVVVGLRGQPEQFVMDRLTAAHRQNPDQLEPKFSYLGDSSDLKWTENPNFRLPLRHPAPMINRTD